MLSSPRCEWIMIIGVVSKKINTKIAPFLPKRLLASKKSVTADIEVTTTLVTLKLKIDAPKILKNPVIKY